MNDNKIDELIKQRGRNVFVLKPEHIQLLQAAYIDWYDCEFGAPGIDCKRPYGNSSVIQDIAEILDLMPEEIVHEDRYETERTFSLKQEEYMHTLHRETQQALQVILTSQSFETGLYERPKYGGHWRKVKEET